jgi:ABC-2 type transport system ATP-binding protein
MAKKGVTVLVTTHYMDEAELCQRVGFISQGKLLALDTPDNLKKSQMRGQVLEISTHQSDQALQILQIARRNKLIALDEVALYGAQIHVVVPEAEAGRAAVRALLDAEGVAVQSIEWIAPSLEDVFISTVRPVSPA